MSILDWLAGEYGELIYAVFSLERFTTVTVYGGFVTTKGGLKSSRKAIAQKLLENYIFPNAGRQFADGDVGPNLP